MRIVGYCRVSTDEQSKEGVSLDAQALKIHQYCELHNHELIGTFSDAGVSAKSLDRPEIQKALDLLRSGEADAIAVTKLDRLTRRVRDLDDLITEFFDEHAGKALISLGDHIDTSTATGRFMLNILGSIGQWEREAIAERTRDALRHKKRNSQRVSRTPFGFDLAADGKTLLENATEQEAIAFIRQASQSGMSLRQIALELDRRNVPAKNGKPQWSHTNVLAILNRGKPGRKRRSGSRQKTS